MFKNLRFFSHSILAAVPFIFFSTHSYSEVMESSAANRIINDREIEDEVILMRSRKSHSRKCRQRRKVIGPKGTTGAAGPQGTSGVQGAIGPTGETGAQGTTGERGKRGSTGDIGATGTMGLTGLPGAIGMTGATGGTGITGNEGPQGSIGNTGANAPGNNNFLFVYFSGTAGLKNCTSDDVCHVNIPFDTIGTGSPNWFPIAGPPFDMFTVPQDGVYYVSYNAECFQSQQQYVIRFINNGVGVTGLDGYSSLLLTLGNSLQNLGRSGLVQLNQSDEISIEISTQSLSGPLDLILELPGPGNDDGDVNSSYYNPFSTASFTIFLVDPSPPQMFISPEKRIKEPCTCRSVVIKEG